MRKKSLSFCCSDGPAVKTNISASTAKFTRRKGELNIDKTIAPFLLLQFDYVALYGASQMSILETSSNAKHRRKNRKAIGRFEF